MKAVERLVHGLEASVRLFGTLAAWLCVMLVLLVTGDVVLRYFFRIGAVWLQELQWHLIAPIAMFGISYALYQGEQVRVVDMVWLGVLIGLILQTSFLTPPFGWSLFFLKGVAPPGVTTLDIYKGVLPFIALQFIAVTLVFVYPSIATWLPKAIGW